MKNARFNFVIVTILFLFSNTISGQSNLKASQNVKNNESFINADINYISDAIFMGRKDSITAPYLFPSLTYHHKSGFYATGSFSYLTKSDQSRIDLFLITAGFDISTTKLFGDLSFTKYFFNEDSYNVISEVEADLTASLKYDVSIVNLLVSSSVYFNKNSSSDFLLSSEISHDFLTSDHQLQFSPTAGIYFGSQNFYEEYYIHNRLGNGQRMGNGNGTQATNTTITIRESEKFNLMAIEFSAPLWYTNNAFTVMFLPALVIPQSEAAIVTEEAVLTENLKESFYWMLGLSYKF